MNYLHYILALIALLGVLPTVTYLLPRHPAHFLPATTVALALLTYFLPTPVDAALSLVVPATYLIRALHIDPVPGEALDYGPAIAKAKVAVKAARDRIRPPEPVSITEFADKAYPDPDAEDAQPDYAPTASTEPTESVAAGTPYDWRARMKEIRAENEQARLRTAQRNDPLGLAAAYSRAK
jgi:hypothetical protein